jgi:RND family efflux transporter MFP subunit
VELDWLVTRMLPRFFCGSLSITAGPLAGAVLLLAITGCNSHPDVAGVSASAAPVESSSAMPLGSSTQTAAAPEAKTFSTTGPLVAEQQADIAAEREGRIMSVAVQIGDHVQKGQLLASLDDRVLRSACDAQKARIASAKAQETEWESEEQTARADLRRAEQMLQNKIISQETWEHAKYRVDETVAEVDRYRNEETASEADLATANLQLEQSRIVAPFSGVVGRSSARLAQQVKPSDVLFWITAEAPLRVLFTVPESVMAGFTVGKPLDLTTSIYPGLHQAGRIFRVSPVVDPASASIQVIGAVDRPSPLLKPGMSMQVRLAP